MNQAAIAEAVSFLESWLAYRARRIDAPGFSVAILIDGEVVLSKAYGFADVERDVPLTTEHLFSVASQTKMVTATAVWQLIEKRKLALDDRVCGYVPWLREHPNGYAEVVTIRQLLNHTSGLTRSGHDNDYWVFKKPSPSSSGLRAAVLGAGFAFRPGHGVKYSNLGFGLLGQVIEAVSRQQFGPYILQNILTPLSPGSIAVDYSTKWRGRVPTGYSLPQTGRRPIAPRRPMHALAPAVGLHASAATMCRLAGALFYGDKRLVSDAAKKRLFAAQAKVTSGFDKGMEFGFGFMRQTAGPRQLVGHDAHLGGHLSATFFDPVQKIAVTACANAGGLPITSIIHGIFGTLDFFSAPPFAAGSPFSVRLVNDISSIQIVDRGDRIVAVDPDDWEPFAWSELLEKVSDKTLRIVTPGSVFNAGELVEYAFDQGRVDHVRLGGMTFWPDRQNYAG